MANDNHASVAPTNFIREIVEQDVAANKHDGRVVTRFPPEPNGYLHIGHGYAAFVSYNIARTFGGEFHVRFDDTNPSTEKAEYVDAQTRDLAWLGLDWGKHLYYASDYFERMYEFALQLIAAGEAYVCELSKEEIREYRGTPTEPGRPSPYRDRSVAENLDLFAKMRMGQFKEGAAVLRTKIDMAAPNLVMRDPVMYRVQYANHYRTGTRWCIYPTYDWAHCLEDSVEGVTHSLCSLEFQNHRPLYDWYLEHLGIFHSRQYEFSRVNISHTVMSKRKLIQLVADGHVRGWDDPRMPTISGMRRRGFTAEALRLFLGRLGVSKSPTAVDVSLLEYCIRDYLDARTPRRMAVLRPVRLVIENYPAQQVEWLDAEDNPDQPNSSSRKLPFSRELYIEADDFRVDVPKGYHRLAPGLEVRLKHAYYVKCLGYELGANGEVSLIRCSYDPESRGGSTADGRKVRGTIHWVSASHSVAAEVRLYERLFTLEDPESGAEGKTFLDYINPKSLQVLPDSRLEPSLAQAKPGENFQFLRQGFFCLDEPDSTEGHLVFNRTIHLKDSWAKEEKKQAAKTSSG
jgi:glutaminyl-tRNA synthetase